MNIHAWEKSRLATPHLDIFEAAAALIEKSKDKYVHEAMTLAIASDATAAIDAANITSMGTALASAESKVTQQYVRQFREFAFSKANKQPSWFMGVTVKHGEQRAKQLRAFIEVCRSRGAELNRLYRAHFGPEPTIIEVLAIKQTETTVIFEYDGKEQAERRSSQFSSFHATWSAAKAWIVARAADGVETAKTKLDEAKKFQSDCRAMKHDPAPPGTPATETATDLPVAPTPEPVAHTDTATAEAESAATPA